MNTMHTYTGRIFDPMKMTCHDVELCDIAHALSMLCRGGGHLKYFYSVGQHCINCANEAQARGWSDRVILACLLHDASEAYISDIIRPVKIHLSNYREIEDGIMKVILEKYGLSDLSEEEHRMWMQIDDDMLSNELPAMLAGAEEMIPAMLASKPDLSEHTRVEICEQYIKKALELLEKLACV